MNLDGDPTTDDCGGDCVLCMAMCGDTDCIVTVQERLAFMVRKMHDIDQNYGCGFYNEPAWREAYDETSRLAEALA